MVYGFTPSELQKEKESPTLDYSVLASLPEEASVRDYVMAGQLGVLEMPSYYSEACADRFTTLFSAAMTLWVGTQAGIDAFKRDNPSVFVNQGLIEDGVFIELIPNFKNKLQMTHSEAEGPYLYLQRQGPDGLYAIMLISEYGQDGPTSKPVYH